jgi:hypothetical protein
MARHDRYGLPLTTVSDAAAATYREGVDLMFSAWPGATEAFDAAIAADPDFALAHIARARHRFIHADVKAAQASVATARTLVTKTAGERERSHVEILALGMEGQSAKSLTLALAHLERWPRDAMIFVLPMGAFGLFAFSGMADHDQARVDLCEKLKGHYGNDWFFLTSLGWSHTENNNVAHGRAITQRAFEARRANANAVHALAHAMFEDGSGDDADRFITDWIPSYDRSGLLHGHICWHQALVALENGDADRALAIYAAKVHPNVTLAPPLNSVSDGSSLLWRLAAYGHEVPKALWADAAAHAERSFPKAGVPFADMHMALVAAATGNQAALNQRIGELEKRLADGKLAPGPVMLALCRALFAFGGGDYAACARILEPVAADVVRIGGSHAQREIIEDTLLVAFMKSGQPAKARVLLDQRLHRRPSPRDARWRETVMA